MASAISFPNDDNISYRFVDWVEWGEKAYELAAKILAKEQRFDRIIALATGGLTLSRAMKDYLNIPKISSLHISFYNGIGTRAKTPVITQNVSVNLQGERILIFDDINDSGESVKAASAYIGMQGVTDIATATIFQKSVTAYPSDYFVSETSEWIIFPDEVRETITILRSKWQEKGVSKEEIDSRLKSIGFTDQHLAIVSIK